MLFTCEIIQKFDVSTDDFSLSILFSIIFGLFDNSHDKWNMLSKDIKNIGLVIGLFTCVQNKVHV